jgi:hypothetical protein
MNGGPYTAFEGVEIVECGPGHAYASRTGDQERRGKEEQSACRTAADNPVRDLFSRMDQLLGLGDGLSASQVVTASRSASTNIEGVRATIIPRKKACVVDIAGALVPVLLTVEICFLDKE